MVGERDLGGNKGLEIVAFSSAAAAARPFRIGRRLRVRGRLFLAAIVGVIYALVLSRTVFGFSLKATGLSD